MKAVVILFSRMPIITMLLARRAIWINREYRYAVNTALMLLVIVANTGCRLFSKRRIITGDCSNIKMLPWWTE